MKLKLISRKVGQTTHVFKNKYHVSVCPLMPNVRALSSRTLSRYGYSKLLKPAFVNRIKLNKLIFNG
jgi:hypothetical protein